MCACLLLCVIVCALLCAYSCVFLVCARVFLCVRVYYCVCIIVFVCWCMCGCVCAVASVFLRLPLVLPRVPLASRLPALRLRPPHGLPRERTMFFPSESEIATAQQSDNADTQGVTDSRGRLRGRRGRI